MSRQRHHQRPAAEAAFGFCQVVEDGADIVTETLYVTDMPSLLTVNGIRKAILTERCRPATTTVQVAALVLPGLTIEVSCHARRQAMERR